MTVREKLIDLCDTNNGWVDEVPAEKFADYLLSNGVTVHEQGRWIGESFHKCSICGEEAWDYWNEWAYQYKYCPNCGNPMEVGYERSD